MSSQSVTTLAHTGYLEQALRVIFPGVEIHLNTSHTNIRYPASGHLMEFDVWIPKFKLSFEFQDVYHYTTTWYYQHAHGTIVYRDNIKLYEAQTKGITLVAVPFWWDRQHESLMSSIRFQRPDLLPLEHNYPLQEIPLNYPMDAIPITTIPNVGELMLASFPEKFYITSLGSNWWLGEKYDGMRCCWHPHERVGYTRYGAEVELWKPFKRFLPPIFVDSELWFGRGQFNLTSLLVRESDNYHLPLFRMLSHDVPSIRMQDSAYETRFAALLSRTFQDNPFNIVVTRVKSGTPHTAHMLSQIVLGGGEGIILQLRESRYIRGRSPTLLKIKSVQADQEGIVEAVNEEDIVLKLPTGHTLLVPATSTKTHLKIGDIVTFYYDSNVRRDLPMNPVIYRVRHDVSWDEVVASHVVDDSSRGPKYTSLPVGHWTPKNMKMFMEQFAKKRGFDPLLPETWVSLHRLFTLTREGRSLIRQFSHGYPEALQRIFPEVKIDASNRFKWASVENRREFFEKYAEVRKFDPLVPENWYVEARKGRLKYVKGYRRVLFYHKGSIRKALVALFPNIGLDKKKFRIPTILVKPEYRRKLFEIYAKRHNFDPLNPEKWYMQPKQKIESFTGVLRALCYHGNSVKKAIADLFPDIGFDPSQFNKQPTTKVLWHKVERRRKFFTKFAKVNGFDPLLPENWYLQRKDKLQEQPGAQRILFYHGTFAKALIELFPNISFDIEKFKRKPITWHIKSQRREFFIEYARVMGFDPLVASDWYIQPKEKIKNFKGARAVLAYHVDSVSKALMDLFPDIGLQKQLLNQQSAWKQSEARRNFFISYAVDRGFNPLIPENWYKQTRDDLLSAKGIHGVLYYHEGSLTRALVDLFPDIGINLVTLRARHALWADVANRRKFFIEYAQVNGFDPLVPSNWYNQSKDKILSHKGAQRVIFYHGNSVSRALIELFPTIGFDKAVFRSGAEALWKTPEARRKLFEKFAKENNFDPLVATNWYKQSFGEIREYKGVNRALRHHGHSVLTALMDLFPEIGLEKDKLNPKTKVMHIAENRRKFFEQFAKDNNFNHMDPASWYAVSKSKIIRTKGSLGVLFYHANSIPQALVDLFPDVGLEKSKL